MILGIDLGTSMVKATAFDKDGKCLASASRRTVLNHLGEGRIEQDYELLVQSVGEVVREATEATGMTPEVIGITGQSDGLWLVDEYGYATQSAVSWLDDRGNPYLQHWIDNGAFEAVFRRNGNAIFPGSHAPLIAAMAAADPEALEQAHTASYLKDAILQRLTGVRITDASDTSLPFLDTRTREYDPEIFRLLGLEMYRRLLSPLMKSPGEAYAMNAAGAALTGLPEGTLVHAGPFDLPACAIGGGVRNVGDGLIIIGTTLACEVLVDEVRTDGEAVGMTLCMPEDGTWIRCLPATVGTAALDWILGIIGAQPKDLDCLLAKSRPGANGVSALPYFSATGERAPFVDVNARGMFSGLNTSTTQADLVMAVCESVAYAARHCMEAAGLNGNLYVCGGGSNSTTWSQMIADALQVPLHISPRPEVGARGASMAAMKAAGIDFDLEVWTKPEGRIEPNPEMAAHYDRGFEYYQEVLTAVRPLWHSPHLV
jgi:erythritol kinase